MDNGTDFEDRCFRLQREYIRHCQPAVEILARVYARAETVLVFSDDSSLPSVSYRFSAVDDRLRRVAEQYLCYVSETLTAQQLAETTPRTW